MLNSLVNSNSVQVKMLMWYGADISMVQSWNAKYSSLYLSMCANPDATVNFIFIVKYNLFFKIFFLQVNHWLQERVKGITRKVQSFAKELCSKYFSVNKDISAVHFVRLLGNLNTKVSKIIFDLSRTIIKKENSKKKKTMSFSYLFPSLFN